MKRYLLVYSLLFLLTGRSVYAEEPRALSDIASENECTSVSGRYQFTGESLNPSDLGKVKMDFAFFYREVIGKPDSVDLFYDTTRKVLLVRVLGEDISPGENATFFVKASCVNGTVVYKVIHNGYSDGTTHNVQATIWLSKDKLGNLIARKISQVKNTELLVFSRTRRVIAEVRFFAKSDQYP